MNNRYSCSLRGVCEADVEGIYLNEDECKLACQAIPNRDIATNILDYTPEVYLEMAPSDIVGYIYRTTGINIASLTIRNKKSFLRYFLKNDFYIIKYADENIEEQMFKYFLDKYAPESYENQPIMERYAILLTHFRETIGETYGLINDYIFTVLKQRIGLNDYIRIPLGQNIPPGANLVQELNRGPYESPLYYLGEIDNRLQRAYIDGDVEVLEKFWLLGYDRKLLIQSEGFVDFIAGILHHYNSLMWLKEKYPLELREYVESETLYMNEDSYEIFEEHIMDQIEINNATFYVFVIDSGWFGQEVIDALMNFPEINAVYQQIHSNGTIV